jgi:GntR family phosphonate transport system transcriptional regulator
MLQAYAFNDVTAVRTFKAALAKDPACAMCAWGVAWQLGPNISNTGRNKVAVAVRYVDYALQRRTRLSQNLAVAGESAQRELVAHERVRGGEWARELGLPAAAPLQLMYTRALVRGRPVGISTAAYPLPRLDGIVEAFTEAASITGALKRLGVADYTRARSVVSCRLPSSAEADALARPATQPVLVVRYLNVDAEGLPVSAGQTLFAGDAIQLTVEPDET